MAERPLNRQPDLFVVQDTPSGRRYPPRQPMACEQCGTIRWKCPSQVRIGRGRFCSRQCHGIWTVLHKRRRVSVPEKGFLDALEAHGIPVLRQHPIGAFIVDGYVPAWHRVIEVDGAYWHRLPAMKRRDERKDAYLVGAGYGISRVIVGREQCRREGWDWSNLATALISCFGRAA